MNYMLKQVTMKLKSINLCKEHKKIGEANYKTFSMSSNVTDPKTDLTKRKFFDFIIEEEKKTKDDTLRFKYGKGALHTSAKHRKIDYKTLKLTYMSIF